MKQSPLTIKKEAAQETFLENFRQRALVMKSLKIAGASYKALERWKETDSEFYQRYLDAQREAVDNIKQEMWRRAVDGVKKPVGWHRGRPGGFVREYSDTLLIVLAKAHDPANFRENYNINHTGEVHEIKEITIRFALASEGRQIEEVQAEEVYDQKLIPSRIQQREEGGEPSELRSWASE